MTKFFAYSEEGKDWICLTTVLSVLPIGKIDTFEHGNETYKVEKATFNIDKGILEVYLHLVGKVR